jgi:putative nucleotidyltransferase-like protein
MSGARRSVCGASGGARTTDGSCDVPHAPALQVLLACLNLAPTRADVQRLRQALAHPALDWEQVVEAACRQGIAALVYHTFQRQDLMALVPHPAREGLQAFYYTNALRNRLLYQDLSQVLTALRALPSATIVLKGAALAETVYPQRALRPMSDVDLLVREDDLSRVEDALLALDYRFLDGGQSKAYYRAHHYHLTYVKSASTFQEMHVEVHWHLDRQRPAFAIDIVGFWHRAVPATIAGVDTLVLSPEDVLLHLCLHTCKHKFTFFGLRALGDIAATLQQYGPHMAWQSFCMRAEQWGTTPYVYLMLRLARDLVGAAVPDPVLRALKPAEFDERLLGWATAEMLEEQSTVPLFPALLDLWKGRGVRDRAALVAQLFARATIAESYALPPASKRVYVYYPVRFKDLVRRYGPVLWQLLCREPHVTARAEGKFRLAAWLKPFDRPLDTSGSDKGGG